MPVSSEVKAMVTVAGVAAAGTCIVFSAGVCTFAAGAALAASTLEDAENCSTVPGFLGAEGISIGTTIVGGAPGFLKAGVEIAGGARAAEAGLGPVGTAAVNLPPSAASAGTSVVIDPRAHDQIGSC